MNRYLIKIEYDGTHFSGWQIQPNVKTVEGELERAFSKILQRPIDLIGQGRTDAGVHAKGQVAHFDLESDFDPQKLIRGVNSVVGRDIYIHSIEEVHDDFHARFDASSRAYTYTVLKHPSPLRGGLSWYPGYSLNVDVLVECATSLVGEHDFNGFSKFNEENFTTICYVFDAKWVNQPNCVYFEIEANRFLRNMVRRLVGTMMEVSRGKLTREEFEEILLNKPEAQAAYTAPAKGLNLNEVFYKK